MMVMLAGRFSAWNFSRIAQYMSEQRWLPPSPEVAMTAPSWIRSTACHAVMNLGLSLTGEG